MSKRFNMNDALEKLYIEIPKALLFEPKYKPNKEEGRKGLSNDAKLLYGVLLDRTYLSIHTATEGNDTKFIDENGDVFIYFDNTSIEEILNFGDKKARAVKKELVEFGLLEEVRQGLGKTNKLYLNIVETKKENLKLYTSEFKKVVDNKKEVESVRIAQYRKDKVETIANTLYSQLDCTSTVQKNVQVQSDKLSSNTESINTDFNNTEFKKSVVVYINGKTTEINDTFRLIQLNKELTTFEKVDLLKEMEYMNENTIALIHKFIDNNILVSQAQAKMLNECVYDVAIKSLNYTIAKSGESFSYFYEIYLTEEQKDIEMVANDFIFKPTFDLY